MLDKDDKWQIDFESLEAAMSEKTRILLLNTPQNPTGKVFSREELEKISAIVDKYPRCFVLSDEVYDFLTFDGREHVHFATIGDNWKRTISVFSGGKMFNATGWKVGWGIGPKELVRQGVVINDTINFCHNVPGQVAFAKSLPWLDMKYEQYANFGESIKDEYTQVRDYLVKETLNLGIPMRPIEPEGGYFLLLDVNECRDLVPKKYFESNEFEEGPTTIVKNDFGLPVPLDLAVSRWLMLEKRVTVMPATLFYAFDSKFKQDNIIRMGICRSMKSAVEAIKRLSK